VSSATEAATAATEAALLTEAYQGVHASNPTTDKHGNALTAGDWYSNSVTGATMVYNSLGQWVNNTNAGVSSINGLTGQVEIKTINNNPLTGVGNLSILGVSSEFAEFLTSGTWTKPAGVTWVYVEAVGGGGSGGVSIAVNDAATPMSGVSTGGGGGRFASKLFKANSLPGTVTVTVGAGGASKSLTKSTNSSSFLMSGSSGGASSFGDLVVAAGGAKMASAADLIPPQRLDTEHRLLLGLLCKTAQIAGVVLAEQPLQTVALEYQGVNRYLMAVDQTLFLLAQAPDSQVPVGSVAVVAEALMPA
jgi:hypothetical protein